MKNSKMVAFPAVIVFCVAAVIALPLRTYQFFFSLQPGTGFFEKYSADVWALYALAAVASVAMLVISVINRKDTVYDMRAEKRPGQAVLSILAALAVLSDAIICLRSYGIARDGNITTGAATPASGRIILIECVLAVVASVYFVVLGITCFSGKSNCSNVKVLSLAPAFWAVMRLIYRFTRTISYVRVSDLLFEILMLAFLVLFFMSYAQITSGIDSEKIEWKIPGYGLPAAFFALLCFVPRIAVTVSGNSDLLYELSPAEYCDLGVALFILCIVTTRSLRKSCLPAPEELKEVAPEEAAEEPAEAPAEEAAEESAEEAPAEEAVSEEAPAEEAAEETAEEAPAETPAEEADGAGNADNEG